MTEPAPPRLTPAEMLGVVTNRAVMRRAARVALIVGPVLTLINQGDALFGAGHLVWWKVMLTFMVPYCVSSSTSLLVALDMQAKKAEGASVQAIADAAADPGAQAFPCAEEVVPSLTQAMARLNMISSNAGSVHKATGNVITQLEELERRGAIDADMLADLRRQLSEAVAHAGTNCRLARETGAELSDTKGLVENMQPSTPSEITRA